MISQNNLQLIKTGGWYSRISGLQVQTLLFYSFYILALLPIFIFRDFTPDNELRYLSITDEAIQNHTLFAFTNHGIPYADKPPLYLWCMMALRGLAGGHFLWVYSLMDIIPSIAIAWVLNRWTARIIPQDSRLVSQVMLLTSGLFLGATLVLRMDMLMCLFIVLAFYEFWKLTENPADNKAKWLFPVFVFLAVFTKGPLGFLFPLVATVVYSLVVRKYRYIALAWGWRCWAVVVPLCFLWFLCVFLEGGSTYLNNLLFHQTMDRAVNSFHHAKPFYYYLIAVWYCLLPWSLAILALIIAGFKKQWPKEGLQTYFTVISLTILVVLSCISSKLQIYFLPAIPFIIYATALSLPEYQHNRWVKLGMAIISGVLALALPAFSIIRLSSTLIYLESPWCWVIASCLSASGIGSLYFLYFKSRENPVNHSIFSLSAGVLATLFFAGLAAPGFNDYIGYRNLADTINLVSEEKGITTVMCGDVRRSENLDVYLNKNIELNTEKGYKDLAGKEIEKPYIFVTETKNLDESQKARSISVGKYGVLSRE